MISSHRRNRREDHLYSAAKEAAAKEAWERFPDLPGVHLRWERKRRDRNLVTEVGSVLATTRLDVTGGGAFPNKATVGETSYIRRVQHTLGVDEIAEINEAFGPGFFGSVEHGYRGLLEPPPAGRLKFTGCVDWIDPRTDGIALRVMSRNFERRAQARMRLADGRWIRFPIEGPTADTAIMSAVTNKAELLVQYRYEPPDPRIPNLSLTGSYWDVGRSFATIEVVVSPGFNLNNQLLLVIAVSAPELTSYFNRSGGG